MSLCPGCGTCICSKSVNLMCKFISKHYASPNALIHLWLTFVITGFIVLSLWGYVTCSSPSTVMLLLFCSCPPFWAWGDIDLWSHFIAVRFYLIHMGSVQPSDLLSLTFSQLCTLSQGTRQIIRDLLNIHNFTLIHTYTHQTCWLLLSQVQMSWIILFVFGIDPGLLSYDKV